MRTTLLATLVGAILLAGAQPALAQSGQDLFQQALVKERADGELRQAIVLYERIARDFSADRALTASALVRMGQCYEKLGSTEAERAYQRVVRDFADQAEYVAQARSRLAALHPAVAAGRGPVARRVLSGEDTDQLDFRDMHPSRDGRRVAYCDIDNALKVRDLATGEVQELAPGYPKALYYSPRWSPDGTRLAVTVHDVADPAATSSGPTAIEIFDVTTRRAVPVPGTRSFEWKEPAEWSADGRTLLVTANRSFLVGVADGKVTELPNGVPDAYSLSPDGRFVAYTTGEEDERLVFVQAVAGGPPHQITGQPARVRNPVWLPDGSGLVFGGDNGISVVSIQDGQRVGAPRLALSAAWVKPWAFTDAGLFYTQREDADLVKTPYRIPMDPAAGVPTGPMEPLPGGYPDGFASFLWSPDGHRIAFTFRTPPAVAIRSVDSGTLARFTLRGQGSPSRIQWSADGQVLFEYLTPGGGENHPVGTVRVLDPATARVRELFPPLRASGAVSFSADGRRMAYWSWESFGPARRMGSISVATTGRQDGRIVATAHGGSDGPPFSGAVRPSLSPAGDRVLFARQVYESHFPQDGASVWVVGSDGNGARKLATLTFIRSAVWDPTGRFVAYTGRPDSASGSPIVLRVVEVATGVTRDVPLAGLSSGDVSVVDWSSDGRYLGVVAGPYWEGLFVQQGRSEYWVVQGLEDATRRRAP
jgi:Tol biopolymer transport system component